MGLLSSSKSSSTVNYNTQSNTSNEDSRQAAGDNSLVVRLDGDSSSFNHSSSSSVTSNYYSADASVIDAAGRTVSGVLPFLTSQQNRAYDALDDMRSSLQASYGTFAANTSQMFRDANTRAQNAEQSAYNFSRANIDAAFNFADDSAAASKAQSDTALAAIRQTSDSLLSFITQREKDPNERAFSQVVPWLVGGAVIIGVFAFGSRSK